MTALVTGASGFLGRHLVRALLEAGRPVHALCRDASALAGLRHPNLRILSGDVRDPASYIPGLAAGTSVFHLAAVRNHPRSRVRDREEINVHATAELARRSLEAR